MKTLGYAVAEPGKPLTRLDYDLPSPTVDQALVRVAGCGLCHTDISFATGAVKPRHPWPLVLGHEIAGVVEAVGARFARLKGRRVIVPAVMPCGECAQCRGGYENTCKNQFMPGNDGHGGFAQRVLVPARWLVELPDDLFGHELADMAVIADAVTTPFQTISRSKLRPGDVAIIVGAGGIGTYGVQIAKAFGATVFVLDVVEEKLARMREVGAADTINVLTQDAKAVRNTVRDMVKKANLPDFGWKVFEMSGTPGGQQMAFNLLPPGGTLGIVGFTMEAVSVRLSNLMALDATCFGNWGCAPKHYSAAVQLVLDGKVRLKPFIRKYPLSRINEVLELTHNGKLAERAVMVPDEN